LRDALRRSVGAAERWPCNTSRHERRPGRPALTRCGGDPWGGALAVLGELATGFEDVSEVISEAVDLDAKAPTNDLLGLYERWRRDGDPRDRRRLHDAGVLLDPERSDTLQ